jgi:hypothetical protein
MMYENVIYNSSASSEPAMVGETGLLVSRLCQGV